MSTERYFREILVVDDEPTITKTLSMQLSRQGYTVHTAGDGLEAMEFLHTRSVDLVIADVRMPRMDGLTLLEHIREEGFKSTVIMMSAFGTFDSAIEAMQKGAYDYVHKPIVKDELLLVIRKAEERERLSQENVELRRRISQGRREITIVTENQRMLEIFDMIRKVAGYNSTVLIHGESGTGKELIARALHENSSRREKPFVAVNCGAIPENLIESELFGYVKGAFTDAYRDKQGLFEEASGGTLFLDEIGELPLPLQVKLLRVLQEEEIRRIGGDRSIKVDVRIVAATARDLSERVKAKEFREDLFYRLNVITITLPPLRERRDDIPLLVEHFRKHFNSKLGTKIEKVSPETLQLLAKYSWPGNVRELENTVERAMILADADSLSPADLPAKIRAGVSDAAMELPDDMLSIKKSAVILETRLITRALQKTGGNRTAAAKLLEISHRALLYKIKEYGINL